jgi:hypothetical protein
LVVISLSIKVGCFNFDSLEVDVEVDVVIVGIMFCLVGMMGVELLIFCSTGIVINSFIGTEYDFTGNNIIEGGLIPLAVIIFLKEKKLVGNLLFVVRKNTFLVVSLIETFFLLSIIPFLYEKKKKREREKKKGKKNV